MATVAQKIKDIEDEMAKTQKNKATSGHLGLLKVAEMLFYIINMYLLYAHLSYHPFYLSTYILYYNRGIQLSKSSFFHIIKFYLFYNTARLCKLCSFNFPIFVPTHSLSFAVSALYHSIFAQAGTRQLLGQQVKFTYDMVQFICKYSKQKELKIS